MTREMGHLNVLCLSAWIFFSRKDMIRTIGYCIGVCGLDGSKCSNVNLCLMVVLWLSRRISLFVFGVMEH